MSDLSIGQQIHIVAVALTLKAITEEEHGLKRDANWHGALADRLNEVLDDLGYQRVKA